MQTEVNYDGEEIVVTANVVNEIQSIDPFPAPETSEPIPAIEEDPVQTQLLEEITPPPPPTSVPTGPCQLVTSSRQYTPTHEPADMLYGSSAIEYMTKLTVSKGFRHDPKGITWLAASEWENSKWDGVTIWDPCKMNIDDVCKALFPGKGWTMRGLGQLYDELQPFADPSAPTVREIEDWNLEVIRLFRRLMGIKTPIYNDRNMFLRSHWSTERKASSYWDTKYPDGTCPRGSTKPHCGANFMPSCQHQKPYLYPDELCAKSSSGAENIHVVETDWPWAIKLSRLLRSQLCGNKLKGHGGPWVHRHCIGYTFKVAPSGSTASFRVKFRGQLVDYCS